MDIIRLKSPSSSPIIFEVDNINTYNSIVYLYIKSEDAKNEVIKLLEKNEIPFKSEDLYICIELNDFKQF